MTRDEWKVQYKELKEAQKLNKKASYKLWNKQEENEVLTKDQIDRLKKRLKIKHKCERDLFKLEKPPRMKHKSKILTAIVASVIGGLAFYQFQIADRCTTYTPEGTWEWRACVIDTGADNNKVILYYHGTLGSEKSWSAGRSAKEDKPGPYYHEKMHKYWGNNPPSKIITITLYPSAEEIKANRVDMQSIINKLDPKPPGLNVFIYTPKKLDHALTHIMPTLKADYLSEDSKVILMGVSMGGANAAILSMALPSYFHKTLLISPLMTDCNPWSNIFVINNCVKAMPPEQQGKKFQHVLSNFMLKSAYKDKSVYMKYSPQARALTTDWSKQPEWLVVVGKYDTFAFYSSNQSFTKVVRSLGGKIELLGHQAGHGYIPVEYVAKWIME